MDQTGRRSRGPRVGMVLTVLGALVLCGGVGLAAGLSLHAAPVPAAHVPAETGSVVSNVTPPLPVERWGWVVDASPPVNGSAGLLRLSLASSLGHENASRGGPFVASALLLGWDPSVEVPVLGSDAVGTLMRRVNETLGVLQAVGSGDGDGAIRDIPAALENASDERGVRAVLVLFPSVGQAAVYRPASGEWVVWVPSALSWDRVAGPIVVPVG